MSRSSRPSTGSVRLAFEEDATWIVEVLESEWEQVAAQAAYAYALERDAGL